MYESKQEKQAKASSTARQKIAEWTKRDEEMLAWIKESEKFSTSVGAYTKESEKLKRGVGIDWIW